jgi:hypothetical protein
MASGLSDSHLKIEGLVKGFVEQTELSTTKRRSASHRLTRPRSQSRPLDADNGSLPGPGDGYDPPFGSSGDRA